MQGPGKIRKGKKLIKHWMDPIMLCDLYFVKNCQPIKLLHCKIIKTTKQ